MRTEPVDASRDTGNAPDRSPDRAVLTYDELLHAVARGDRDAFALLYDLVAPSVVGVIRAVVRNPAEAEEVAAEVFVELWRTAARYTPNRGGAIAWALSVAHRRAVDRVRSTRRDGQLAAQRPLTGARSHDDEVRRGLGELNEFDRAAILLAFYDGRTYREVAATLTVTSGTVRYRLRDGLRRLGDCLT